MQDVETTNGAAAQEGGPGETKSFVAPVAVKYEEYIHSLRWEMKRQEAFRRWGRICPVCGKGHVVLDVHHLSYARLGKEEMHRRAQQQKYLKPAEGQFTPSVHY